MNREQLIVASGIDDILCPLLSLHVTFLLLGTRLDNVGASPWWNVTVSFPCLTFHRKGRKVCMDIWKASKDIGRGQKAAEHQTGRQRPLREHL